jgi:hypothetical protein
LSSRLVLGLVDTWFSRGYFRRNSVAVANFIFLNANIKVFFRLYNSYFRGNKYRQIFVLSSSRVASNIKMCFIFFFFSIIVCGHICFNPLRDHTWATLQNWEKKKKESTYSFYALQGCYILPEWGVVYFISISPGKGVWLPCGCCRVLRSLFFFFFFCVQSDGYVENKLLENKLLVFWLFEVRCVHTMWQEPIVSFMCMFADAVFVIKGCLSM